MTACQNKSATCTWDDETICLLSLDQSKHNTLPWCPFKILLGLIVRDGKMSNFCAMTITKNISQNNDVMCQTFKYTGILTDKYPSHFQFFLTFSLCLRLSQRVLYSLQFYHVLARQKSSLNLTIHKHKHMVNVLT